MVCGEAKMKSSNTKVQYWEGTAAADARSQYSVERYLRGKGLIKENESLVAASLYATGEITNVTAVVSKGKDLGPVEKGLAAKGLIPVRRIKLKLTREESLYLFKGFDLTLTWQGSKFEGREILRH
jgi:hypothetical protein